MPARLIVTELPPVAGTPGLVQGSYGDAGNLELAVPAMDGGAWIFWFNADPIEHHTGAAQGCWSRGLRVFDRMPVQHARISQLRAGPNFLELLLLGDATLHRLYWTPTDGFVDAGPIATDVVAIAPLTETAQALLVDTIDGAGRAVRLIGDKLRYPLVSWTARELDTPPMHGPPDGFPDHEHDALAWARTTLAGGRIDVVLRRGSELFHVHGHRDAWSEPERIVSQVWSTDS